MFVFVFARLCMLQPLPFHQSEFDQAAGLGKWSHLAPLLSRNASRSWRALRSFVSEVLPYRLRHWIARRCTCAWSFCVCVLPALFCIQHPHRWSISGCSFLSSHIVASASSRWYHWVSNTCMHAHFVASLRTLSLKLFGLRCTSSITEVLSESPR